MGFMIFNGPNDPGKSDESATATPTNLAHEPGDHRAVRGLNPRPRLIPPDSSKTRHYPGRGRRTSDNLL
jgi:hypothetical protein